MVAMRFLKEGEEWSRYSPPRSVPITPMSVMARPVHAYSEHLIAPDFIVYCPLEGYTDAS